MLSVHFQDRIEGQTQAKSGLDHLSTKVIVIPVEGSLSIVLLPKLGDPRKERTEIGGITCHSFIDLIEPKR